MNLKNDAKPDQLDLSSQSSSCQNDIKEMPQTPWKSIILVGCFAICTGAQFGLFFASIWPYMQIVSFFVLDAWNMLIRNFLHLNIILQSNDCLVLCLF
jgi:hypothetical protein